MCICNHDDLLQAVLEGKWPSDSVNSKALWRRIRHLVMGVSQFRRALKNRSRCSVPLLLDWQAK